MSDTNNGTGLLAPSSPEAEEAVLGGILINPDGVYEVDFLSPSDFCIVRNGWVFDAMLTIRDRGEAIDNLTVADELKNRDQLESSGGPAYLTMLGNNTPTHIHVETYARIVERASIRRKLLNAAQKIGQAAMQENSEIEAVIEAAEDQLFSVTRKVVRTNLTSIGGAAKRYYDLTEYRHLHPDEAIGIPTPFDGYNEITGGLRRGRLVTIAGRPGKGKTALMLTMARYAAELGFDVAFESIEMSEEEMLNRFVAQVTGINSRKLDTAALSDEDWALFNEALPRVEALPLYLDDPDTINMRQLRSEARALKRSQGLDVLFVDYLQLMLDDDSENKQSRNQEVNAISRGLKQMAKELDICVVAGCQMNRAVESRLDGKPQLTDLRESGGIEQDSDVVIFIDRKKDNEAATNLVVAKNRGGPTNTDPGIAVLFDRTISLFTQSRGGVSTTRSAVRPAEDDLLPVSQLPF